MIMLRMILSRAALGLLAFFVVGCSMAQQNKTLSPGMTPDQAVQAMGAPDLQDNIADPNHSGGSVLRYVWLEPGKAAIFGADERVASIQNVEVGTDTKQQVEQQAHVEAQRLAAATAAVRSNRDAAQLYFLSGQGGDHLFWRRPHLRHRRRLRKAANFPRRQTASLKLRYFDNAPINLSDGLR